MDLYHFPGSPPCHAVIITAKNLGINLNIKFVNLMVRENLSTEYVKINPQKTVPTLVDQDSIIWESRAIIVYLAQKYDKNGTLYPNCPKKQAVVNQRLYFDMGTLYQSFADYYYSQLFDKKPANPVLYKKMENAFDLLNTFLDGNNYVAGDQLTVADFSILASVSMFDISGFDIGKYVNVGKWYENAKKLPGWEENWAGVLEFKKLFM